MTAINVDSFDRTKLSERENQILDLAIAGLTDQQIGLKLRISASTVNTYWARIRVKLGSKSRTELVANALRLEAEAEIADLRRQVKEYEALAAEQKQLDSDVAAAELYRVTLDAMPQAILVRDEHGRI